VDVVAEVEESDISSVLAVSATDEATTVAVSGVSTAVVDAVVLLVSEERVVDVTFVV